MAITSTVGASLIDTPLDFGSGPDEVDPTKLSSALDATAEAKNAVVFAD